MALGTAMQIVVPIVIQQIVDGQILAAEGVDVGGVALRGGLALATIVFTVGECFTFPLFSLVSARLAPAGMVGRYLGLYRLIFGLAYSLGPWFGALLFERWAREPVWLWGGLSIWAAVAAVFFLFLPRARIEAEATAAR